MNSVLIYDINFINCFGINEFLSDLLKNYNALYPKCGYKNGLIINEKDKNKYKYNNILEITNPMFIFISFDFSNEKDLYNEDGSINNTNTLDLISYIELKLI